MVNANTIRTTNKVMKYAAIAVGAMCSAAVSSLIKKQLGAAAVEQELADKVSAKLPWKKADAPDEQDYMRDLTDEELFGE